MQKTYFPKAKDLTRQWVVVDAEGQNLGRLATRIARTLLGKDKTTFTPGAETGDFVVVINAEKVTVTGKRLDDKFYYRVSGYPGGIRKVSLREQLRKHPERVLTAAVRGMLPKNRYGRALLGHLRIYAGAEHPHTAQTPKPLKG